MSSSARHRYGFLCQCGRMVHFDDAARGTVVACECDLHYRVPARADLLRRAGAHLRWLWRWWRAGGVGRASQRSGPYRSLGRGVSCPRCKEAPPPSTEWQCELCYCTWNTFETRARCPGCGFRFLATACHACGIVSRHADWYAGQ